MPELRGGAHSAAGQKKHGGLETTFSDVEAADHSPCDLHAPPPAAGTRPFDRKQEYGHQLQPAREIEDRTMVLESSAAAALRNTVALKAHLRILPAEYGGRDVHGLR